MEFTKQIVSWTAGIALLFLVTSCAPFQTREQPLEPAPVEEPAPQPLPPREPLALLEVVPLPPLPPTLVQQQQVQDRFFVTEPIYTILRIVEVSEVNGIQRFFLVRMGTNRTGITAGVSGEIAADSEFTNIIGNFRILELQGDFFRGEITELMYRIGTAAHVRIQSGEITREVDSL